MKGPTRTLTIAIIIVAAPVAFVPALLALTNCVGLRGEIKDWFVPVDADSLVHFSHHIVIARYLDEAFYQMPSSPHVHPNSPGSLIEVYRRFEVAEPLKGDFRAGDVVLVGWEAGYYERNQNEEGKFVPREVGSFSPGTTHVLFLTPFRGRRPPGLDPGVRVWRTRTGVGIAGVDARGRLSFETNAYYRAALKDMALKPVDGSGAPFALTVDGIRELVANGPDPHRQ